MDDVALSIDQGLAWRSRAKSWENTAGFMQQIRVTARGHYRQYVDGIRNWNAWRTKELSGWGHIIQKGREADIGEESTLAIIAIYFQP
jgi:hypothetical protein